MPRDTVGITCNSTMTIPWDGHSCFDTPMLREASSGKCGVWPPSLILRESSGPSYLVRRRHAWNKGLSQSSIFGQNPKIGCQEFNDLQTPKLSKKQLCDRTERLRLGLMGGAGAGDRVAPGLDQVRCNRMKSHRSTNRAS